MIAEKEHPGGQTLVQFAVLMVVLMGFVALAIEGGRIYLERRRMQNAADAGALAGAYQICFGTDGADPLRKAEDYAILQNGAEWAEATYPDGQTWKVSVVATETLDLGLAAAVGLSEVTVGAEAIAACSGASTLCGVWPITFHKERWDDIEREAECPAWFFVWNDDRFEAGEPFTLNDGRVMPLCEACDCTGPLTEWLDEHQRWGAPWDGKYFIIGSGSRGWVNFPRPEAPFPPQAQCLNNCGTNQIVCIINSDGYLGQIEIPGEGEPALCLPSQTGVATNILHAVENNLNKQVNILLWDRKCGAGEPPTGECPASDFYRIVGTGCVTARAVVDVGIKPKPEYAPYVNGTYCKNGNGDVLNHVKSILVEKECQCHSACGSTPGNGPPSQWEVKSVSLIK